MSHPALFRNSRFCSMRLCSAGAGVMLRPEPSAQYGRRAMSPSTRIFRATKPGQGSPGATDALADFSQPARNRKRDQSILACHQCFFLTRISSALRRRQERNADSAARSCCHVLLEQVSRRRRAFPRIFPVTLIGKVVSVRLGRTRQHPFSVRPTRHDRLIGKCPACSFNITITAL